MAELQYNSHYRKTQERIVFYWTDFDNQNKTEGLEEIQKYIFLKNLQGFYTRISVWRHPYIWQTNLKCTAVYCEYTANGQNAEFIRDDELRESKKKCEDWSKIKRTFSTICLNDWIVLNIKIYFSTVIIFQPYFANRILEQYCLKEGSPAVFIYKIKWFGRQQNVKYILSSFPYTLDILSV